MTITNKDEYPQNIKNDTLHDAMHSASLMVEVFANALLQRVLPRVDRGLIITLTNLEDASDQLMEILAERLQGRCLNMEETTPLLTVAAGMSRRMNESLAITTSGPKLWFDSGSNHFIVSESTLVEATVQLVQCITIDLLSYRILEETLGYYHHYDDHWTTVHSFIRENTKVLYSKDLSGVHLIGDIRILTKHFPYAST